MNTVLLITLSGLDRPGLVGELAEVIAGLEANWEQSRMMHLADRFIGILEVHVRPGRAEELISQLQNIGDLQLTISTAKPGQSPQPTIELEVTGTDNPGIVKEIFSVLGSSQVNVETLRTHVEPAPDSGQMLFYASARLSAPTSANFQNLQEQLEAIAGDIMVSVNLVRS